MNEKKIEFGEHAKNQIKERGISEVLITEAFCSPDLIQDRPKGRKLLVKKFWQRNKKFVLVIVYKESQKKYYIVTAWYSNKVNKYFKTT